MFTLNAVADFATKLHNELVRIFVTMREKECTQRYISMVKKKEKRKRKS